MTDHAEIAKRLQTLRRVKKYRDGEKLSQAALGQALSMSREKIAKLESGKQPLSDPADIIAFADFYGVSCDYILRGYAPENTQTAKELGLSNDAIEELRDLNRNRTKSCGFLSDVFDREHGAMSYILEKLDSAIELAIQYELAQIEREERDLPEILPIHTLNGITIEHEVLIYAYVRMAGDAFVQNMYEYAIREGRKHAKEIDS